MCFFVMNSSNYLFACKEIVCFSFSLVGSIFCSFVLAGTFVFSVHTYACIHAYNVQAYLYIACCGLFVLSITLETHFMAYSFFLFSLIYFWKLILCH